MQLFFDQNVMEKMSKKRHKSFQNNVDKLILEKDTKVYHQIFTPFGLWEFAGFSLKKALTIQYKGKKLGEYNFQSYEELHTDKFILDLEQQIRNKFTKSVLIEKLKTKKIKDIEYLSSGGRKYIEEYEKRIESIYEGLVHNLLLDRISQINTSRFSMESREKFINLLTRSAMEQIICQRRVIGAFRFICKLHQELKRRQAQSGELNEKPETSNVIEQMTNITNSLKPTGDLVDCELIHLAFFGSNNNICHCYTTDDGVLIKKRLEFYCVFMNFLIWLFFEYTKINNKPPFTIAQKYCKPEWRCGKVFILNKSTGEKITKIPVKKIYEQVQVSSHL